MAQLVAHLHGMEGVGSSNLPSSTVKAFEDFLGSLFFMLIHQCFQGLGYGFHSNVIVSR